MKQAALSIIEMNDRVFAEFTRLTGSVDRLLFPPWWAAREREVIKLQCEGNPVVASARWSCLKRAEQQRRLLLYLTARECEFQAPPPLAEMIPLRRVA